MAATGSASSVMGSMTPSVMGGKFCLFIFVIKRIFTLSSSSVRFFSSACATKSRGAMGECEIPESTVKTGDLDVQLGPLYTAIPP